MNADSSESPARDAATAAVRRAVQAHLSVRTRLFHVALLLVSTAATIAIASLLIGERGLPRHTQVAFVVLVAIGTSWVAYAAWVLTRSRPLFGRQRVVAGSMALAFAAVFTAGLAAVGLWRGGTAPFVAAGGGVGMCVVAALMLARARREVAALTHRRAQLELEASSGAK